MADLQQSRTFKLKSVTFTDNKGNSKGIAGLVASFSYVESIVSPFVAGTLVLTDSAGFFNAVAISGGETVSIVLTDVISNVRKDEDRTYNLVVWKVANRIVSDKAQIYTLGLISQEALINEGTRVAQPLKGKPEAIIANTLLKENIKTEKEFFSDPSQFEMNLLPNRRRPFDIAAVLATKAVPQQQKWGGGSGGSTGQGTPDVNGTAGYFFWESYRGYNFVSVDTLCKLDDKDRPAWGPYEEQVANADDNANRQLAVLDSKFSSEVNVMANLRLGKYASLMVFFDPQSGQYDEYVYKLKDSYEKMEHLGSGGLDLIPATDIDLSEYPTRYLSMLLDHETWHSGASPGSPEADAGSKSPAKYPDWQKYFASQSIARFSTLKNQECTVVVPGNYKICAGDRIDIRLKSKLPDSGRKLEPFDRESSGVYLIREVTHDYDLSVGNGKFQTTLRLCRDSYGLPDSKSKHGN